MGKNRYKNYYTEHVRYGMQRRVNILMTYAPKKGDTASETEKIFKRPIDKNFLKQSLSIHQKDIPYPRRF